MERYRSLSCSELVDSLDWLWRSLRLRDVLLLLSLNDELLLDELLLLASLPDPLPTELLISLAPVMLIRND